MSALAFDAHPRERGERPAAPSATRCACSSPARPRRSSTTCSAACPPTCAPATCSWSTRRATMPAALSAGDLTTVDVASLDAASPGGARRDRWVVELRRCGARLPRRARARASASRCPAARPPSSSPPTSRPGRLWIAALDLPAPLDDYLAAHGRPIAYAPPRRAAPARGPPDGLRRRARQRGDAERRPAVHPARARRPASRAACRSRRSSSTPASRSLELGERPYPERYRVPALTATRVNAHRAAGGRVIAVGTTVVRALETVAAPTGGSSPARAGRADRSPPSAACARSTGCSPAGTSPTPATC